MLKAKKNIPKLFEIVRNPDGTSKLNINLHDGQRDALSAKERFVLMLCGSQSGKTSFAPIWLMNEISANGAGDYLALSASYDLMEMKFRPELDNLFCGYLGFTYYKADRAFVKYFDETEVDEYGNKHTETKMIRVVCRSAESKKGLESTTAKAIVFDEAGLPDIEVDVWEAIRRRASLNRARVLITTTPYNLGWLKTEVYDRCLNPEEKDYKLINFKSTLNPLFSQEEFEDLKRTMPEWKFKMFYEGEFTRPAAMIYDVFNFKKRECLEKDGKVKWITNDGHIVKHFDIPEDWIRYIGVDFGSVNSCVVFIAEPHNMRGTFFVYHTLHGSGSLYEKVAAYKREFIGFGGASSEDDWRMQWGMNGVPIKRPKICDVEAGIDRVYALFKRNKLFILEDCEEIINEIRSYSRVVDAYGNPTDDIENKNKYHHMDALRYICSIFFNYKEEEKKEEIKKFINPLSEEGTGKFFDDKRDMIL